MAAQAIQSLLVSLMEMTAQVYKHYIKYCKNSIDDCLGFSKLVDGTREDYSVLTVDTCGTEDGLPAAWIQVKQTGIVTFFNQNGDKSTCILDKGFKVGSRCNTFNPDFFLPSQSSRSSILLTTPTTFTSSTSSPLAMTPLAKSTSLGCVAAQ